MPTAISYLSVAFILLGSWAFVASFALMFAHLRRVSIAALIFGLVLAVIAVLIS
jgi:hypothetical protein